ncbi:hypothetical protein LPB140_08875 [Sphingorhabdus lutea]|uniref:Uncharacterized protein n=1 Tax=Sphingorhabdus lutea TaxID=1913578 RepID=A0A1L3JCU3_9SPHN|nr:hypothetical protein [Sphingorhabdus lutea]APG62883.1 hypothetical protein LPB140_08875 [Sphingorhabdus lutea]
MGKSNLQASLEKKYAVWSGELLEVQKSITKIEESHAELSVLRSRATRLEDLVSNAKNIFFEVNPEWDAEQIKPIRPGRYALPFEIGTVSKDCMTILRENDRPMPSREIGKMILERHNIADADWQLVDRVRGAVDACMRSRRDKYVKGEGEYPIYWSIIPA